MRYAKILLLTALIAIAACSKDLESERIAAQEKIIDTYWETIVIDNTNVFAKDIAKGTYRIVLEKGDEQPIVAGDTVYFYYTGAILAQNGIAMANIFDTNISEVAQLLGLSTATELTIREEVVGEGRFISGLEEGLLRMHKGEKAQLIFTSSLGYGAKVMNTIPAYSPIIFEVKIEDVK